MNDVNLTSCNPLQIGQSKDTNLQELNPAYEFEKFGIGMEEIKSEIESETGNLVTLPIEDEFGYEDASGQGEPDIENQPNPFPDDEPEQVEAVTKNLINIPSDLHLREPLKETFRKNELPYQLIKRNEAVALYGVGGIYTDKILHYEVCQIYIQKAGDRFGKHFPETEILPGNEKFGRDKSRAIVNYEDAVKYYDELTTTLKTCEKGKINT
jgi:hypothetical protein